LSNCINLKTVLACFKPTNNSISPITIYETIRCDENNKPIGNIYSLDSLVTEVIDIATYLGGGTVTPGECISNKEKEKLCVRLYDVNYNNDPRGCGTTSHLWLTAGGGNDAVYTDWTWDIDGTNVIAPADNTFIVNQTGGAGWNQNFTLTNPVMTASNPFGHQWEWFNAGKPCYRIWSVLGCDANMLKYGLMTVTITRGSLVKNVTMYPEINAYKKVTFWRCSSCGDDEQVFLDGANNVITDLFQYVSDQTGIPLNKLTQYFPTLDDLLNCVGECDEIAPEIPDYSCNNQFVPVCDEDNPDAQISAIYQDCGDGVLLLGYVIEDPDPNASGALLDYTPIGNIKGEGCEDCIVSNIVTLCDQSNCEKIDFLYHSNCPPLGPFIHGTNIPYEGKGPFLKCEPKIYIGKTCYIKEDVILTWDNGAGSDPNTGLPLPRPPAAGTGNGYNTVYDTPYGQQLVPADFAGNGFIDKYLKCGGTIQSIDIGGNNILLNGPIVLPPQTGSWLKLSDEVFNQISTWFDSNNNVTNSFPPGRGCDNNRPDIIPVNCWGQSNSCYKIQEKDGVVGTFTVTDCRDLDRTYTLIQTTLGETRYEAKEYVNCNGQLVCDWFVDKKIVETPIDLSCFTEVPCNVTSKEFPILKTSDVCLTKELELEIKIKDTNGDVCGNDPGTFVEPCGVQSGTNEFDHPQIVELTYDISSTPGYTGPITLTTPTSGTNWVIPLSYTGVLSPDGCCVNPLTQTADVEFTYTLTVEEDGIRYSVTSTNLYNLGQAGGGGGTANITFTSLPICLIKVCYLGKPSELIDCSTGLPATEDLLKGTTEVDCREAKPSPEFKKLCEIVKLLTVEPGCNNEVTSCIQFEGFDGQTDENSYDIGDTSTFDITFNGSITTIMTDYLAVSDNVNQSSWYTDIINHINNNTNFNISVVTDVSVTSSGTKVLWQITHTGPSGETLEIIKNGGDIYTFISNGDETITTTITDDQGSEFNTLPIIQPC